MIQELVLPLSLTMSLISFSLVARWYALPWMLSVSLKTALTPILLFHSFRHIGMSFLLPGVTAEVLDSGFADPAAYGDLLAAALALLALLALRLEWSAATGLVWLFNIIGTLDLLNALFQGTQRVPPGHLGATHFLPAVIVLALLVTHYLVFRLLMRRG